MKSPCKFKTSLGKGGLGGKNGLKNLHLTVLALLTSCVVGFQTVDMTLRRNSMRQLGFHVHFEGIVSEVEHYGFAWQAGLRPGSRLVEICKVAMSTLTHDQMIDLLRTSVTVKVVVIPPLDDGMPRR